MLITSFILVVLVVLDYGCGGGVGGDRSCGVIDSCSHVVEVIGVLVSGEQEVNGLARCYGDVFGAKWLGVACV